MTQQENKLLEYLTTVPRQSLHGKNFDYRIMYMEPSFGSKLFEIKGDSDAPTHSEPLEVVKKEICRKYILDDWQFQIENIDGRLEIAIVAVNRDKNAELIGNDMYRLGYFKSRTTTVSFDCVDYIQMQFEPLFQDSITNEVRSMGYLFHVTPYYNIETIKKLGLLPLHQNSTFDFPDRVYLVKGTLPYQALLSVAQGLCDRNEDSRNDGQYCILTVNVTKVPDDVEFYQDPNFDYWVFTDKPIPFSSVIGGQIVYVEKEKTHS